jgi:hypothetical protein
MVAKKNKATQEQKDNIIALSGQGMSKPEIARQLGLGVDQVSGICSWGVKTGMLPPSNASRRVPKVSPPPADLPVDMPNVVMSDVPQYPQSEAPMNSTPAPISQQDNWRQPTPGAGDGFTHPTQIVEYKVERVEPKDGILEVVQVEPGDDELGKRFGSGTYRIWKREGTKVPVFRDVIIAQTYGDPRFPHRRSEQQSQQHRPGRFFGGRPQAEEDEERGQPFRPFLRPPMMDVRSYQDRQMADVASRGLNAQESIAVTAVNKLAEINEKQLDRMEKDRDREREPQSVVTDFLKEQQISAERRSNAEAGRREEERKREQDEWRRREDEREAQHKRDMERIKAENDARISTERETRQTLIDLEKQKMDLVREESRSREASLRGELERIRVEAKEERATFLAQLEKTENKTAEQIEAVQASVKEELDKEREGLKREHELKEKHLDNEQKLKEDMLKLREEILKGQQGEDLSKVLAKLVEGVERTVKEVVDLKKIEAVSAEERLARVGQQGTSASSNPAANVTQGPAQIIRTEQPAAMQGSRPANGQQHAVQTEVQQPAAQEQTPETMVRQLAREQAFIQMISKWAKQVQAGNDAGIFSNMFMELMRDDGTVEALKIRKACSYFVDEMSTKTWAEMYDFLKPAIPQNFFPVFETPHAEVFYEQFKMMVVESVRDYWKMYFAQKQAEIEAAKQGVQSQRSEPSGPVVPAVPAMRVEAEEPKSEVTVSAA